MQNFGNTRDNDCCFNSSSARTHRAGGLPEGIPGFMFIEVTEI